MAEAVTSAETTKSAAESLIPLFHFQRLLNQDQHGRRAALLGSIHDKPALLSLERAAFPTDSQEISNLLCGISDITNLGANDIYHWYMASHHQQSSADSTGSTALQDTASPSSASSQPDLKLNLIYPCTDQHVKKYSPQVVRMVTETPEIYARYVRPYMQQKREQGRLNWVFNIIEGRTEQEDVILRERSDDGSDEDFLLLPDLNWDRKTIGSLHLLALVERRDLWSLRDLNTSHVVWLKRMREKLIKAAVRIYGEQGIEEDMLKLYIHYQPTYYHFHIHIVNVMLEAGATQATGKAFGLENLISQLETMGDRGKDGDGRSDVAGMADVSLTYFLGEASELWRDVFAPLKEGTLKSS